MASATVTLGREGQVFINPYTGAIIGEGAKGWRGFFRVVEDAHRWLALSGGRRNVGKSINDAANLLFLFLAISGVYIWLPRRLNWKHFKAATVFRSKVKGKARDFNWHTVIGFWTSLVLIILTLTGVVISYQWAGNLVYTLTGNEVPQQQQAPPNVPNQQAEQLFVLPENLNDLWTKAETHTPYKTISLRLPIAKDAAIFTIEEGIYWNIFARSTLTIDAKTAEVAKWEAYGEQNLGRQLRSWIRFTHTGETGGIVGQFIGFAACVGGAFLVWTGISLALRRFGNWRTDKRNA
ncbi:MAG: PepSY domain-containing protein [Acidobacteria bacterium]|nr:PepSY domain-containing protein [Acidobacteriota bacterium]